jgi:hypothetical protein
VLKPKVFTNSAPGRAPAEKKCAQCDKPHPSRDFRRFREGSLEERAQLVKEKKLCFKCLESGHGLKDCTVEKKCGIDGCKSVPSFNARCPLRFPIRNEEKRF